MFSSRSLPPPPPAPKSEAPLSSKPPLPPKPPEEPPNPPEEPPKPPEELPGLYCDCAAAPANNKERAKMTQNYFHRIFMIVLVASLAFNCQFGVLINLSSPNI